MALDIGSLDITYGQDGGPSLPSDMSRMGLLGQDWNLSASAAAPSEASVAGLRDRLLREARQERVRCLQVAEASERWRADARAAPSTATSSEATMQTDPVTISTFGGSSIVPPDAALWCRSDDEAQTEAIRTIQLLHQKQNDTSVNDRRIAELEEMIKRERESRQELEVLLTQERQNREAVQQQVLCLEAEMDNKESALQASHNALDRKDSLQHTDNGFGLGNRPQTQPVLNQASLGSSNFRVASPVSRATASHRGGLNRSLSPTSVQVRRSAANFYKTGEEAGSLSLQHQQLLDRLAPLERDRKREAKDHQISQLLQELRRDGSSPTSDFEPSPGGAWNANLSPMSRLNATAPIHSFGLLR